MLSVLRRLAGTDTSQTAVQSEAAEAAEPEAVETAVRVDDRPWELDRGDLALAQEQVADQLRRAEDRFQTAFEVEADLAASQDALTTYHGWRTALAAVEQVTASERAEQADGSDGETLHVDVDGYTLQQACGTVLEDSSVESMLYLTGIRLDENRVTLNRAVEVPLQDQSAVSATGDPEAQFDVLGELEADGYQLFGHVHNHPSSGAAAASPSADDYDYQEDLELLGYDAVGWVVTADGYLRAFSHERPFTVEIHGDLITTHDEQEHLFRVTDV